MRNTLLALLLCSASVVAAQDLQSGFLTPPQESRPRVWWHWMNGNITLDGIRKDIEWMHRAGIGGFHSFDAGMGMKPVVEQRLDYMSEPWKKAFRLAVGMADSLGMEVAVASCPGWSNTGGPWVTPEQAMKKLVWTDTIVKGGRRQNLSLLKSQHDRWYADIAVLAVRIPDTEKTLQEMNGLITVSRPAGEEKGPCTILCTFQQPQTIKALSISDGRYRSIWAALPAPVDKFLEASDDGLTFRRICDIPHGSISWQTINIPPTTARYFRVVVPEAPRTPELKLFGTARIDHIEEKAGFASPPDMNDHPTQATADDAVALTDVVDVSSYVDAEGCLSWKAPKGRWRLLRFGYTLTGKENHPASPEATGLEVTKLDSEAFSQFLNYYLDLYRDATGGLMGQRGLHYLLIDSYEAGWETWSPRLADEFRQRRGYSLLPWMPVLTGQIVESAERSEEFLFDWRTTIGELIGESMYATAARIAHERGMEAYFEAHENGRLYLVDGMTAKSHADIPMAAMWTVIPGKQALNSSESMAQSDIRESASVAHLYGKPIVAAESMTVNGHVGGAYCFHPGNLKHTADLEMASGVNRFVIHESAHQPVDDKRPGLGLGQYGQWFNRHETWAEQARAWTDYLARSCYMLQQGSNVADPLLLRRGRCGDRPLRPPAPRHSLRLQLRLSQQGRPPWHPEIRRTPVRHARRQQLSPARHRQPLPPHGSGSRRETRCPASAGSTRRRPTPATRRRCPAPAHPRCQRQRRCRPPLCAPPNGRCRHLLDQQQPARGTHHRCHLPRQRTAAHPLASRHRANGGRRLHHPRRRDHRQP